MRAAWVVVSVKTSQARSVPTPAPASVVMSVTSVREPPRRVGGSWSAHLVGVLGLDTGPCEVGCHGHVTGDGVDLVVVGHTVTVP